MARVAAAGAGEQPPVQRPALHAAARHVAGAEHDVGALARGVDQARDVGRIVGEVGVHLDDEVGAGRERLVEAGEVGAAEAALARAVVDADSRARERARRRAPRSRPATVVDDEHGAVDGRVAARERGSGERRRRREVLALVVGGDHDPGAGHGGSLVGGWRRGGRAVVDRVAGTWATTPVVGVRARGGGAARGPAPSGWGAASRRSRSAAAATRRSWRRRGDRAGMRAVHQAPGVRIRARKAGVVVDVRPRVHDVLRVARARVGRT